jgi:hypothetical protein
MRSVKIFIENLQIDLFNDETIEVTSSVQNIADIATVFTDFSQSFTIPCTPKNNRIFEHYYNNDVDTTIDHNKRRKARIEIDTVPFRTGKIQLEKSQVKKSNAESYSVTFFGDIVTFKDLVLEDKLKDLDYSTINHQYTGAEVQARIETDLTVADYDVKYPLISSSRVWDYGVGGTTDINATVGAIAYTELFPAVRVASIFKLISIKYGVTFTGNILNNKKFIDAFLLYKSKEAMSTLGEPSDLVFGVGNVSTDIIYNSKIQQRPIADSLLVSPPYDYVVDPSYTIQIHITTASSVDYWLDVYKNGVYSSSLSANGSHFFEIIDEGLYSAEIDYTFKIRATSPITYSGDVIYAYQYFSADSAWPAPGSSPLTFNQVTATELIASTTTTDFIDLSSFAPDMKIMDFMKGIFNTFNLTVVSTSPTSFKFQTLKDFYNSGTDRNITKYVITDEITISRPKLYNAVSFEYEKSNCFLNRKYFDLFGKEYSNLKAVFGYDGGDYTIKLPFETLLHQKFTNTDLQVAYTLGTEPEYKNYIPKAVLLYQNKYTNIGASQSFKFNNSVTTDTITDYIPFGQDADVSGVNYSLNFNSDISSFTENIENNSLYATYYEEYLTNLFSSKTRLVDVKTIIPISMLTSLKLNDSLIIRDKKYIINSMKSNLTTGEVSFSLITNQRESVDFNQTIHIDYLAQDVVVDFSIPEGYSIVISLPLETQFATPANYTPIGEEQVNFACTLNAGTTDRTNTFPMVVTTPDGVLPNQYLTIIQAHEIGYRIIETATGAIPRVTEDGQKRIIE